MTHLKKPLPLALTLLACISCSDPPAAGPSSRDPVEAAGKLVDRAVSESDPAPRLEILSEALAILEPLAISRRDARHLGYKAFEMSIDAAVVMKDDKRALSLQERYWSSMDAALAGDPGDGRLRGHRAYIRAIAGQEEEAWRLVLAGIDATEPAAIEEDGLLHYASAIPAFHEAAGRRAEAEPGTERLLEVVRAFLKRARDRGEAAPRITALLNHEGSLLVRLGRYEEAQATSAALEQHDPGSLESFKLKRLVASMPQPPR